mmetsp:Transcript_15983/g.28474  ORF Transcript_15983/g.28474 Transcript_15983/m.28474 type:complete len:245 (+) Transcript_15983:61-795(+)
MVALLKARTLEKDVSCPAASAPLASSTIMLRHLPSILQPLPSPPSPHFASPPTLGCSTSSQECSDPASAANERAATVEADVKRNLWRQMCNITSIFTASQSLRRGGSRRSAPALACWPAYAEFGQSKPVSTFKPSSPSRVTCARFKSNRPCPYLAACKGESSKMKRASASSSHLVAWKKASEDVAEASAKKAWRMSFSPPMDSGATGTRYNWPSGSANKLLKTRRSTPIVVSTSSNSLLRCVCE